jgi:hypothetical protein
MKKIFLKFLVVIILASSYSTLFANPTEINFLQNQQIEFIENKGQIADQNGNVNWDILFLAKVDYGTIAIRKDGVSFTFIKSTVIRNPVQKFINRIQRIDKNEKELNNIRLETYRVDMKLNSSNPNPLIKKKEMTEDFNNYYFAHCPDGITNVRKFKTVVLENVYPNTDLVLYTNSDSKFQYDFVLKPGANPNLINFKFEGAKDIQVTKDGELKVFTPFGNIEQKAPVSYQLNTLKNYINSRIIPAKQEVLRSRFFKNNDNSISFNVENYNTSQPLIIDPVSQIWGTYYGGNNIDIGTSVTNDSYGNIFLAGHTNSEDAISTSGTHQIGFNGNVDAFLTKFDRNGIRLWATYYGGEGIEYINCSLTDETGNTYLTGQTDSRNAISTSGAHQSIFGEGHIDAFLVKFNNSGERIWGTYYGGDDVDYGYGLTEDVTGNIYLVGITESENAIATTGAFQTNHSNNGDAFLVKFNIDGIRQWGTYFGSHNEDGAFSVTSDLLGNIYMTGATTSEDDIATSGAHQMMLIGGDDAFLAKFNSNGERIWCTYYGGYNIDIGSSVIVDKNDNIYLVGYTGSETGIVTSGANQTSYGGGFCDAFLAKFNGNGKRIWGTYYGGSADDFGFFVTIDRKGDICFAGGSFSNGNISTAGSYQTEIGGDRDAILVKFNSIGKLQWGTYYGGGSFDTGNSVSIDDNGNIYLAGFTFSEDKIATSGAYKENITGERDAFLVKFKDESTDIKEIGKSTFDFYPNPATSKITLTGLPEGVAECSIYDVLGNEVLYIPMESTVETQNFGSLQNIDVSALSPGVYFLRIGFEVRKFIVLR